MSLLGDFSNIDNTLTGDTNLQSLTVSDFTCDFINGLDGTKLANLTNSTSDLQTQINSIVAGTPNTANFVNITDTQTVGGQKSFSTAPLLTTSQVSAVNNNLISKLYADTKYQPVTTTPVSSGFVRSTLATNALSQTVWLTTVSATLGTAGKYLIIYTGRISTNTTGNGGARIALFNPAGIQITDSTITIHYLPTTTAQTTGTGSYVYTSTVDNAVITLRMIQNNAGLANILNDSSGYNSISFIQVASNGSQGVAGTNGTNGVSPTLSLGTVSTLPVGSAATVVQSGTALAPIYSFSIPQGANGADGANGANGAKGDKGDTGDTGAKGDTGTDGGGAVAGGVAGGISGGIAGTAAGTVSGSEAGAAAGATAGAEAASTAYESRVLTLENKTVGMSGYPDVNGTIHTEFKGRLSVMDSIGYEKIKLDGDNKTITIGSTTILKDTYITTPALTATTIYCNDYEATDSYHDVNIGKVSNQNINIGNQQTAGLPLMETTINLYGRVNFGYNTVIGTGLFQF